MTRARSHLFAAASLAALVLAGCGSDASETKPAAAKPVPTTTVAAADAGSGEIAYLKKGSGYPGSVAVLGHSGATGQDSDPKRPNEDAPANSWATGTNPAVRSIYLRVLARNPAAKGHNTNLALDGATVDDLLDQAKELAAMKSKPDLALVQIMDNDIVCPAAQDDYASFESGVLAALKTIARGAPNAGIFVVSPFGSEATYVRAMTRSQRATQGGEEPCDATDPTGRIVASREKRMDGVLREYSARLEAACKAVEHCRYDGGAAYRASFERSYLAPDLNHLTVKGHAKAAGVAWSALRRAGLLPG